MRIFVEHLASVVEEGAFGVHGDEGGAGIRVGLGAGSDDVGVDLGTGEG